MAYNSLTEAPHNLKEGIDWLVALKGKDAEKSLAAMGDAIHKFLADKPVGKMNVPALEKVKLITKEFLEKPALNYIWPANELLRRFKGPLSKEHPGFFASCFGGTIESDYANVVQTKNLTAETIAKKLGKVVDGCEKFLENVKNPDEYKSSYSSEASWEASCAKDPEACAVVLVGIAPMLYAGLHSLLFACNDEALKYVRSYPIRSSLEEILRAVGYEGPECCAKISGPYVLKALKGVNSTVLSTIYDLAGFWAFY
ncbi:hypothetical protein, conserved [Babesia ovata]|uniref:Uncharacterized protein n=1 Tax=Babesia ovata TaxID=189622 RepID=A0A2H6KAN1_9APIC|nr:uncharacterized protein BOVATA_015470 [Babesia ovata]GBE60054.1 hypothetical protein, conserved [Babesia ovata]